MMQAKSSPLVDEYCALPHSAIPYPMHKNVPMKDSKKSLGNKPTTVPILDTVRFQEKNIEHCSLVRSGSELPKIDSKKLESFGVDKALIVQGLSYLSNRNFELCEGKYRVDLAYQLGVLKNLGDYYEVKLPPIDNIKKAVIYPTNREIEAELIYNNLPIKAKEYISNAVGNEPFNLLKTISVNKLLE